MKKPEGSIGIDGNNSRVKKNEQSGKRPLLVTLGGVFEAAWRLEDILNPQQGEHELERLNQLVETAKKWKEFQFSLPEDASRWNALRIRVIDTELYLMDLDDKRQEIELDEQALYQDVLINHALQLGAKIALRDGLEQQVQFCRQRGFRRLEETLQSYTTFHAFEVLGDLSVRIGGLALTEVLKADEDIPPHIFYRFLVLSFLPPLQRNFSTYLEENHEYPANEFPNLTIHAIAQASSEVTALTTLSPKLVDDALFLNKNRIAQRAGENFKRMQSRFDLLRQNTSDAILTPDSPQFQELKEVVESFLHQGKDVRIIALHGLLTKDHHIYRLYRRARELSQNSNYPEFYELLANTVREYVEELPSVLNVPTTDDLPTVFDEEKPFEERRLPTERDLGNIVHSINASSSQEEYTIDPEAIQWGNMIPPQQTYARIDVARKYFTIEFVYESETGESLKVLLYINTRKNHAFWTFLEHPSESEKLQKLYKSVILAARDTLLAAKEQAKEMQRRRTLERERLSRGAPVSIKIKREKPVPPSQETIEKPEREKPQAPLTPILMALSEAISQEVRGVKNLILLSDETELTKKLTHISEEDQKIVRSAIADYNGRGVGKFKRKKLPGPDGRPFYTLAIGTTVPSGVRVLLQETTPSNGVRNFEIIDIRYRKDIYRKHGL